MKINLLQKDFDKITELFINGLFEYDAFEQLEKRFIKNSKLFTVCLNF